MERWHKNTALSRSLEPQHPLFEIRCRQQTYRGRRNFGSAYGAGRGSYEEARRSFYKWVCKHELYGPLRFSIEQGTARSTLYHYRLEAKYSFSGAGYARGYPAWEATRSEAKNQWEDEFRVRREQILDAEYKRAEEREAANRRVALLSNKHTTRFFKLLSVGDAIAQ